MAKRWYNLFVSVDRPTDDSGQPSSDPSGASEGVPASPSVADLAAGIPAPQFKTTVDNPTSFDEIYRAAEIRSPAHGYSIVKVAEMLQSEHIRNLPIDVKRSSILVALDAAGVKIEEIIQDAVRRDRALDTYERVQQKALLELEARKTQENAQIQAELDRLIAEHRTRMQANNDEVAKEKERIYGWQLKKQQEEQRIADAVAPFVSENPISTGGAAAAPRGASTPKSQKT